MTLTQLRRVTKPGQRRGQARITAGATCMIVNDRLSGLVAYTVVPRLERGQQVEVRWSFLRKVWRNGRLVSGYTPWVTVTS